MTDVPSRLRGVRQRLARAGASPDSVNRLMVLQAATLAQLHECRPAVPADLRSYEFQVFSQWGEDGILQFLTREVHIRNRTFVEFGVEDFTEANCRLLLEKDLWSGYVLDGNDDNIARVNARHDRWRWPLQARSAFVTRENVHELLVMSGFDAELGILSIDIDGVDYFVAEELSAWHPSIIVVEYNAAFGCDRAVTVPYDAAFDRKAAHWSHLYYGASLPAFTSLFGKRGYALVGVNSAGNNAFFVRRELLTQRVVEVDLHDVYRESVFCESRGPHGHLTYLRGPEKLDCIGDLPLEDVSDGTVCSVADLPRHCVAGAGN